MLLQDANGYDVLEACGADRDTLRTQHAPIIYAGTSLNPVVDESDSLTLVIRDSVVPSAGVQVDLYYATGA